MLWITIPETEYFDESVAEFMMIKEQRLQLEHSLVSVSKWESKWKKAFLGKQEKTPEESLDYIRCMTITQNVKPEVYYAITPEIELQIKNYIEDPMTATTFHEHNSKPSRDIITAELIYYWMFSLQIPMECEKWHLNRLLALIRTMNIKNAPAKKMPRKEALAQQRALNASRKQKYHTKG